MAVRGAGAVGLAALRPNENMTLRVGVTRRGQERRLRTGAP